MHTAKLQYSSFHYYDFVLFILAPYKTLTQAVMEYVADHNKNIYFFVKATCKDIDKNNLIYKVTKYCLFAILFILCIVDVSGRWLRKESCRK